MSTPPAGSPGASRSDQSSSDPQGGVQDQPAPDNTLPGDLDSAADKVRGKSEEKRAERAADKAERKADQAERKDEREEDRTERVEDAQDDNPQVDNTLPGDLPADDTTGQTQQI